MADHIFIGRIVRLAVTGLILEAALFALAHFGPAFAPLVRVGYWIVAVVFLIAMWRERHRSGQDRREGEDRRHVHEP